MIDRLRKLAEIVYKNHNKISDEEVHETYDFEGITMYVYQKDNLITISALNTDTQRGVDLTSKKYSKLFKSYNEIAKISYSNKNLAMVTIKLIEQVEEVEEVKETNIHKLNSEINNNKDNNIKEIDIELIEYLKMKFGNDYMNKTINAIEQLQRIKDKRQNAGRKQKFNQEQINKILELREEGTTIKELSNKFKCGVATIHKLISENK